MGPKMEKEPVKRIEENQLNDGQIWISIRQSQTTG